MSMIVITLFSISFNYLTISGRKVSSEIFVYNLISLILVLLKRQRHADLAAKNTF